jgi:hypothetical protein
MRHQYRITKYDPALRDADGAWRIQDWTSHSDIGRRFGGLRLTQERYEQVEAAYLFAIGAFLAEAKIESLTLRGMENHGDATPPRDFRSGAELHVARCVDFARLALREQVWGRLTRPGRAYVHFGYDYYMYIGVPSCCASAVAAVRGRGLFVESFRSPYLRKRAGGSARV